MATKTIDTYMRRVRYMGIWCHLIRTRFNSGFQVIINQADIPSGHELAAYIEPAHERMALWCYPDDPDIEHYAEFYSVDQQAHGVGLCPGRMRTMDAGTVIDELNEMIYVLENDPDSDAIELLKQLIVEIKEEQSRTRTNHLGHIKSH